MDIVTLGNNLQDPFVRSYVFPALSEKSKTASKGMWKVCMLQQLSVGVVSRSLDQCIKTDVLRLRAVMLKIGGEMTVSGFEPLVSFTGACSTVVVVGTALVGVYVITVYCIFFFVPACRFLVSAAWPLNPSVCEGRHPSWSPRMGGPQWLSVLPSVAPKGVTM